MTERMPRVGVIGAGSIGKTHIRAWQANGVTPVAFADANPAALGAVIAEYGGEGYADGLDLISADTIDIVSICTPPRFHADLAIAALDAGIAVLCEKPMARTLVEAERMAAAVERTGTLLSVGFCHRFQPQIETLKAMIDRGELGTVMSFRNRFAGHKADAATTWFSNPELAGGGVLADTSVHSIDLFRFLVGDAARVAAMTSTRETDLGPTLEVDDTAAMLLQTADGAIGVIESSWRTPAGEWTLAVHGTKGTAVMDYGTMALRVSKDGTTWEEVPVEPGDRFAREFAHFLACWRGEASPRVTAADGLAANRILDRAYRSATEALPG
jgi:predicted dehydrogenase